MKKKALIIGSSGQAGFYLAHLLRRKGYDVAGTYYKNRSGWESGWTRSYMINLERSDCRYDVHDLIMNEKPDEVYNLASRMFAPDSWKSPIDYMRVNAMATTIILDQLQRYVPYARYFQAGSAEIFDLGYCPQSELTRKRPRNPYGVAKLTAQEMVRVYREQYGMFACTGILFNMESPRRPKSFFSTTVATQVAEVVRGERANVVLGNLTAKRDWGWTEEYVEAMWRMLQASEPRDFVIGTGETHSCLEFVEAALQAADLPLDVLVYDEDAKPRENDTLQANPRAIEVGLGWEAKTKFLGVVQKLVEAELKSGQRIGA